MTCFSILHYLDHTMDEKQCDSLTNIEDQDSLSSHAKDNPSESDVGRTDKTFCQILENVFESQIFQLLILALVVIDMAIVTVELTCSLEVVEKKNEDISTFVKKVKILNLVVISIFVLEIATKISVYRRRFLKCYELFDAAVIATSFILDIVSLNEAFPSKHTTAAEFIIVARFWRIVRIVNGTIFQIRSTKEDKVKRLVKEIEALKEEIRSLRSRVPNVSPSKSGDFGLVDNSQSSNSNYQCHSDL